MTRAQELARENRRLKSAIAAIHDHLHADRVNEAHEACECALTGEKVTQPNLTVSDGAKAATFAESFNALADKHRMNVCWVGMFPSATVPGAVSIQMGGEVTVCKIVEARMRGASSTYMGEHGAVKS